MQRQRSITVNKTKFFISLVLAVSILIVQVGGVIAAPAQQAFPPITGIIEGITIETDVNTGITTVIVNVLDGNQVLQTVRVSEKTAEKLGLVVLDVDGNPKINDAALGQAIEIKLTSVIPNKEENQHPVANALATFFSDIADNTTLYNTIMEAHNEGVGFGIIAQILWLTREIPGGDLGDFRTLLLAKQSGDYTSLSFVDENGTTITAKNWGELRTAILAGKKISNLGKVVSNKDNGNGADQDKNKDNNKDKNKDKHNGNDVSENGNKEKKK
jgi:hypothetical protein